MEDTTPLFDEHDYQLFDYPGPARISKKIEIEIWEDSEATFFLSLATLIKTEGEPNMAEVKKLLDTIYPFQWNDVTFAVVDQLRLSWEYVHNANKYGNGDYLKVSLKSFDEFMLSKFAHSLTTTFTMLNHFKSVSESGKNAGFKTFLSLASDFLNAQENSSLHKQQQSINTSTNITLENTDNGIFNINGIDLQLYAEENNHLRKIETIESLNDVTTNSVVYVVDNKIFQLKTNWRGVEFNVLNGARIINGMLDLSYVENIVPFYFPSIIPETKIEGRKISCDLPLNQLHGVIEYQLNTPDLHAPISINKELENEFTIPENVKKASYVRHKIATEIYHTVNKCFPELSIHAKCAVTGYLSIPFDIMDTEAKHEDSPRTGTYHAYVIKTVKNILNSKP
jgi:hypothetical protein